MPEDTTAVGGAKAEPVLPSGTPVIGIGASAGGLNALKRLLAATPDGLGAAVVVVQHLDPTHPSMMSTLLARHTAMPVREAEAGVRVEAGTVYTIPPGKILGLRDDRLTLDEPAQERFHRTPIDHFFRTLAEARGDRSIGVVLSGTGSDGVQGVRDIKAAGGVVLVQTPDDAEFDGMPRAAADTGLVDFALPADELPGRLGDIVRRADALSEDGAPDLAETEPDAFADLLHLVADRAGYDFRDYKRGTLNRRIHRRMALTRIRALPDYLALVREDGAEATALTKDLLIGVTRFFRDPESWEAFAREVVEPILARLESGDTLRAWAPGCATGEEAYTLGMVALDRIERSGKRIELQVFASDLNPDAIATARAGRYPASSAADMPSPRFEGYFNREEDTLRVTKRLRDRLVFAAQNAIADPPFSGLDCITCRNLLIYLDAEAQDRVMETFHFALKEGGFLMLGRSESADRQQRLFEARSKRHRIYQRRAGGSRGPAVSAAGRPRQQPEPPPRTRREERQLPVDRVVRAMLARFAPPAVLVNEELNTLSFHGDVSRYIGFRPGVMTGSVVAMVEEALQARLWNALQGARRTGEPTEAIVGGRPHGTAGSVLRLLVEPVPMAGGKQQYLVYFLEEPRAGEAPGEPREERPPDDPGDPTEMVAQLQTELAATRRELQEVIERADTPNEELQAANEEVMSANEELQSSNEELETSREELQSLNEELSTINSELEEKVAELEATNDDLANLIASTDIATIFLDTRLCIRRFSARTRSLMSVVESDVGRPLAAFALHVHDSTLLDDARRVLERLETAEVEVKDANGSAYLRRITPYRTRDDRIEGVIITFSDVSKLRLAAQRLEERARWQASVAELGELALATEDLQALLDRAVTEIVERLDAPFVEVLCLSPDGSELVLRAGSGWARGVVGASRTPADIRGHAGFALRRPGPLFVDDFAAERRFKPSELLRDHDVRCGLSVSVGPPGRPWGVLGAFRDARCAFSPEEGTYFQAIANILWLAVSQDEARRTREDERHALRRLMDGLPMIIAVVGADLRFELCNRAFETFGWSPGELEGVHVGEALGPEALERAGPALRRALGGERASLELPLTPPAETQRTYLVHTAPRDAGDGVDGVFLAALDITDRKRMEERNAIISAELDHRVKNILALVNTIARMTGRRATTIADYKENFEARIDSLARTHIALADAKWSGMRLRELVTRELAAYVEVDGARVHLEGPDVLMAMRPTQSLALAFHELTTNAVKYGALAEPGGRLDVSWAIDDGAFRLEWRERPARPVEPPRRDGFGARILRAAVADQLDGTADLEIGTDGLAYRFRCRLAALTGGDADAG